MKIKLVSTMWWDPSVKDYSSQDLGALSYEGSIQAIKAFNWEENFKNSEDGFSSITILAMNGNHFDIRCIDAPDKYFIEVIASKQKKFLGLFSYKGKEFYEFKNLSMTQVIELLKVFYTVPEEQQFQHYKNFGGKRAW